MQVSGVCDFSHLENKAEQGSEQPITCWHESTQSLGLELGHPELPVSAEAQSTPLLPKHLPPSPAPHLGGAALPCLLG